MKVGALATAGRRGWPSVAIVALLAACAPAAADHGDPKSPAPSGWRKLTTKTREIVEPGGHDLHKEIPGEIANEIRTLLGQL